MRNLTSITALCGLVLCSSVFAQQSPTKPPELNILRQVSLAYKAKTICLVGAELTHITRIRKVLDHYIVVEEYRT